MSKQHSVLSLGVDLSVVNYIFKEIPECDLNSQPYDFKFFEAAIEPGPLAILCGEPNGELQATEVAQSLRMVYPNIAIYFISVNRQTFNRKQLQKNGFTDAFLLPADQLILTETLRRLLSLAGELKAYRNVRVIDIPSESVLGFDLFLHMPANNKYVKYAAASDVLNEERAARLRQFKVTTAAVSEDQVAKFYAFTAQQLKNLNSNATMSETEKKELRENAVRNLFTGIFGESGKEDTLSQGRGMMTDCQEIIKSYIMDECGSSSRWLDKMMSISSSSGGTYNHAANTSTYAALFAIGMGIAQPDEVALAGLLHDIGLADVPAGVVSKQESERTPEETALFQKHPLHSVNMIKEKKLIVSEKVMKIIVQHHERFDGKGYPEGLGGHRVLKEAQVVAIADIFDYLTQVEGGKARVSPIAAMNEIKQMNSAGGGTAFDPVIVQQIASLFESPTKQAA